MVAPASPAKATPLSVPQSKLKLPKQSPPPPSAHTSLPTMLGETQATASPEESPGSPAVVLPEPVPFMPSLGIIEAPDLTYYPSAEVDEPAVPTEPITPFLPVWALKNPDKEINGRALLRLWVDEKGEVEKVDVVESNPSDLMDDNALYVWRHAKFNPAIKNGKAVRNQKLIEVTFGDVTKVSPDQLMVVEQPSAPGSDGAGESPRFRSKRDH